MPGVMRHPNRVSASAKNALILAAPVGAFRSEPRLRRGSRLLGEVREGAVEAPSR
jgi:hypothetical protein